MIKLKSKKTRMGIMLFLVPALVIYLVFQIIPIIGSIYFSLVDWNGIAGSTSHGITRSLSPITSSRELKDPVGMKMKYHIRPTAVSGNTVGTKNNALKIL